MSAPDAVAFAAELAAGTDRRMGLTALASNWGVNLNDPQAMDFVRTAGLEAALGVLVAVQNPERGVAWAEGLLSGADRRQALHDSVRQLARSDPKAAIAYANTVTDPQDKRSLLTGAALGWAESDGTAAYAWASSVSTDPVTRADLISAATLFWARQDLAAATLASLSQPAELRARTLGGIATGLYQRDSTAAEKWQAQLPDGDAKVEASRILENLRRSGYEIHNADGSTTTYPPAKSSKN